jgi:hypothetical protein
MTEREMNEHNSKLERGAQANAMNQDKKNYYHHILAHDGVSVVHGSDVEVCEHQQTSDRPSLSSDGTSASRREEEQGRYPMTASGSKPTTSPYNPSSAYSAFLNQIGRRGSESRAVGGRGSGTRSGGRHLAAHRYVIFAYATSGGSDP